MWCGGQTEINTHNKEGSTSLCSTSKPTENMNREPLPIPGGEAAGETGIIIKVFLVNGESRSLRIYNWSTVTVSTYCLLCAIQTDSSVNFVTFRELARLFV